MEEILRGLKSINFTENTLKYLLYDKHLAEVLRVL